MKACKIAAIVLTFSIFDAYSQGNLTSISMPASPAMPSMSAPSIGSGFYIPGSSNFYSGVKKEQAPKKESASETEKKEKSDLNTLATSLIQNQAGLQDLSSISNRLTASDLSGLDSMGMLGSFSSLLNKNNNVPNSTDTVLLNRILTELNDVKSKIGQTMVAQTAAELPKDKKPKIIRFNVNGHDILSGCNSVYFSKQDSDGSFLLTADRKYFADNKNRNETFYFLFHASGNNGGITSYNVTPEILQDYKNSNSLVYKMCQNNCLKAQKTGNLVKLIDTTSDIKIDLLLSLD